MMYAKGNDFIKDFVTRTKWNLSVVENGSYEVTQLINSMVGLLIIPEQKQYDNIVNSLIDNALFQKMLNCIVLNTYRKPLDLQQICRHLRNGVAHSNLSFEAEKSPVVSHPLEIHSIMFADSNVQTGEQIKIKITVDLLKEFLLAFSDAVSNLP